jgi:hypothetical protein
MAQLLLRPAAAYQLNIDSCLWCQQLLLLLALV